MVSGEAANPVDVALPAPHPGQVPSLGELNNDLEHFWGGLHKVLGQREPELLHLLPAKTELLLIEGDPVPGALGMVLTDPE